MKQVFLDILRGEVNIADIPSPCVKPNHIIIQTTSSLVSSGTERSLLEFGKANLLSKAVTQKDKLKELLDKLKNDGLLNTSSAVIRKFDKLLPLGYCNVGRVKAIGEGVKGFKVGDRVISNGAHSEIVLVPENLCSKIPDNVSDEEAAFTILASIGLQGIRLAKPTFGETFIVSGLGMIGILTCQILQNNGCNVIALEPNLDRCKLAKDFKINAYCIKNEIDTINFLMEVTNGRGVDGAIITALTTSNEPINLAAKACRQRGRIILVGVTGLQIRRDLFYAKELSFQVSCSYGPGRYDKVYEQDSIDYPLGYVRWTENRNFEAILNSISKGNLITKKLISHRFKFEESIDAFNLLSSKNPSLGILLEYENKDHHIQNTITLDNYSTKDEITYGRPRIGIIGAGNYAKNFLLPQLNKLNVDFTSIVASNGIEPIKIARKYKFKEASTDQKSLLSDKKTNTIIIATRHNSHADLVKKSLLQNKHVYVEKPLCLSTEELGIIKEVYTGKNILMVGYNRRFSPLTVILKNELNKLSGRKNFIYTINAGKVADEHWVKDSKIGGGRLLGEACHFVDLLRFLASYSIKDIRVDYMGKENYLNDNFSLTIKFEDNSLGIIHYLSNGSRSFPKERLEVFCQEKIIQLNNFKSIKAWGIPRFKNIYYLNQDKGQRSCIKNFLNAVSGKTKSPIPIEEIFEVQSILLKVCNL